MRERQIFTVPFPLKGIDESRSYREQPEGTTRDVLNMRPWDPVTGRARGAQRSGLGKYTAAVSAGASRIQDIVQSTVVPVTAAAQTSLDPREVRYLAVDTGVVYEFDATGFTAVAGGITLDASAPVIFSTTYFNGDVYFADGTTYRYWDADVAANGTLTAWVKDAATIALPVNGVHTPRLIETWRGRLVLAGIKGLGHNWYMSAVEDPDNFDYSPSTESETQAVAGNNSPMGNVGQPIMSIAPINDDLLVFGCDHSIWQVTGDPQSGGRLDEISDITGMAFGRPWCKDPNDTLYFMGSRGGMYRYRPGTTVERLSASRIESRMGALDLTKTIVRMVWNDRDIGVHIFATRIDSTLSEHWYYDVRTDSFWIDHFANEDHNPVAVLALDGDDPDDRMIVLGGQDGYIRKWSPSSKSDDGSAIESTVLLGPIQIDGGETEMLVAELQAVIADASSDVTWTLYIGNSAEQVFSSEKFEAGYVERELGGRWILEDDTGYVLLEQGGSPTNSVTGTFDAIRSYVTNPRLRGYSAYLELKNTTLNERWAYESLRMTLAKIASRGRRLA